MRRHSAVLAIGVAIWLARSIVPVLAEDPIKLDLAADTAGAEPMSFAAVVGIWRVELDGDNKVLAVDGRKWQEGQASAGLADKARALYGERYAEFLDSVSAFAYYPYVVAQSIDDFSEGEISVRFEVLSGRVDQGAGILFNLQPNGDYLTVRANALESNLVLWKFEKGKRSSVTWVRNVPTQTRQWHELKIKISGTNLTSWLDGKPYLEDTLPAPVSGRVGLWSKAEATPGSTTSPFVRAAEPKFTATGRAAAPSFGRYHTMIYQMKPLACDPQRVKGMSERLIISHYENNYGGAVKRLNQIAEQFAGLDVATAPNFVINGLKREELIATNSMILHELFFAGLGEESGPGPDLTDALVGSFGSLERWRAEFVAMGKAQGGGSGWVLLTWSPRDRRLVNQWAADHTMSLAGGHPILALDMYEHSYHIDFGAKAGVYVETFMQAIQWASADALFAQHYRPT
jgi:superoxide dismutase